MALWTALAIGFFGSFHCIGMCGPIALALPGSKDSGFSFFAGRILYNLGRILTYALLGVLFGLVGHSIILAGFQQLLSVVLGIFIIAAVWVNSSYFTQFKKQTGIDRVLETLKGLIHRQFQRSGAGTLFTIGLLNGLLPCGFVYVGLAGSLTAGSAAGGALFMVLFGLGTFPSMFMMSIAPGLISLAWRKRINKLVPVMATLFGAFLLYRGFMMVG